MKPIQSSLALAAMLAAISPLAAQDQNSEVIQVSPDMFLRWYGHAGRTYFVQISDPNDHLRKWIWAPIIETGNDEDISYEVDGTADKGFFRLWFTDEPTTDPDGGDFDGDGLSNLAEVTIHQTNPLNPDTDGDGMPDGWEVFYALNPLDAADGNLDPDNDGLTNAQEYQHGTNPNLGDTDGDGVTDGGEVDEGTDPTDPLDTPEAEWVILTGDLDEDDEATKSRINGDRFLVRNPSWSDYDGDTRLWSSDWWSLFATNDGRYDLKWRGRFGTLSTHTNPHNYYSKGEEVLMKGDGSEPSAILEVTIKKELAWIKQEMGKGSLLKKVTAGVHTANGGWAFNGFWNGNPPATNPPLIANPYFKPFSEFFDENGQNPQTVHGATGSNLASQFALRAFMLAHDVPAVSNPAGSDFIDFNNNNVNDDAAKNTDMMGKRSGGWGGDWKRSDLKNQKIDRVFELYDDMATKGNLKK